MQIVLFAGFGHLYLSSYLYPNLSTYLVCLVLHLYSRLVVLYFMAATVAIVVPPVSFYYPEIIKNQIFYAYEKLELLGHKMIAMSSSCLSRIF